MSLSALKDRMGDLYKLGRASALMGWDQQVNMPRGGANARADQQAALSKLHHQMLTSTETLRLLEAAESAVAGQDKFSDDAAFVRMARRDYDNAVKVPTEVVTELERSTSLAHEIWAEARKNNDFAHFLPILEKIFDLVRQVAEYQGYTDKPYDALMDIYEPGLTCAEVTRLFGELRQGLVPLVKQIAEKQGSVSDAVLRGHFPIEKQRQFNEMVIRQYGFDFTRGRQDVAVHPFCTSFSCNDVRITTRYYEDWIAGAMFGTFHETGHGLYELGIPEEWDGNVLSDAISLGIHESQSRLWENVVGRSKAFWTHFYPKLQETFPEAFGKVDLMTFYRAINQSKPSFIRVEADEVTYNLHIMLRFDIETAVINDGMKVSETRDMWNDRVKEYLGIVPPNDTQGVLQDVHWSSGIMGYFPTYSLGNLLSVQFYNEALKDHPGIPDEICNGQFATLHNWMKDRIYSKGRKYLPKELVQDITGTSIQTGPFLQYLTEKYTEVYGL